MSWGVPTGGTGGLTHLSPNVLSRTNHHALEAIPSVPWRETGLPTQADLLWGWWQVEEKFQKSPTSSIEKDLKVSVRFALNTFDMYEAPEEILSLSRVIFLRRWVCPLKEVFLQVSHLSLSHFFWGYWLGVEESWRNSSSRSCIILKISPGEVRERLKTGFTTSIFGVWEQKHECWCVPGWLVESWQIHLPAPDIISLLWKPAAPKTWTCDFLLLQSSAQMVFPFIAWGDPPPFVLILIKKFNIKIWFWKKG